MATELQKEINRKAKEKLSDFIDWCRRYGFAPQMRVAALYDDPASRAGLERDSDKHRREVGNEVFDQGYLKLEGGKK